MNQLAPLARAADFPQSGKARLADLNSGNASFATH